MKPMYAVVLPVFAIMLGVGLLAGCGGHSSSSSVTMETPAIWKYKNNDMDYSILFPTAWRAVDAGDDDVSMMSPTGPNDPYQESVNTLALELDEPCSVEDYNSRIIEYLLRNDESFHFVGDRQAVINDRPAIILDYTYEYNGITYYSKEFEVVVGDRVYIVMCDALPETIDDTWNVFLEIGYSLDISYKWSHYYSSLSDNTATKSLPDVKAPSPRFAIMYNAARAAARNSTASGQ